MPSKSPTQRLTDILDNIQAIADFIAGMTFDDYSSDRKTVYAVTRALKIISEASRRLPDELKQRHPEIAWATTCGVDPDSSHAAQVMSVWATQTGRRLTARLAAGGRPPLYTRFPIARCSALRNHPVPASSKN